MSESLIKVGITHGDINGVSYELIFKIFSDTRILELCTPIIYGSSKVAAYHRKAMSLDVITFNLIERAEDAKKGYVNIVNCVDDSVVVNIGESTAQAGESAYVALDKATADLQKGSIDVLLTAPINKSNIQSETFNFKGHTDFLQDRIGDGAPAMMIMADDTLRVALVTAHVPISEVPGIITEELVVSKIKQLNYSLKRDFRIETPRIAVLGLNPHAGEDGLLGGEELSVISPAIKAMQEKGILCAGPFPADGLFGSGRFSEFDGILAMYHDQGLIPFKTLAMENGVNFTAGLPFVRTSPDHGVAYDIAGKNIASELSFRQALYMALDVYRNRISFDEACANPLRKMYFDKGNDNEGLDLASE